MCDEQTIEQLIDDLGGKDYLREQSAKEKLVECGKTAVEALIATLQNRSTSAKSPEHSYYAKSPGLQ